MRKTAQVLIGLAISLVALGLAFRGANLAEVGQRLAEADYFYLVPAIGLYWLGILFRALSWRVILAGRVPLGRVYAATTEGYLLNNLLPLRLGEFGRAYLVSRGGRVSTAQALSSVVVERVVDLLMVMVLLAFFLPLVTGLDQARNAAVGTAALGLGALAGLVLVARFRSLALRLGQAVLARLPVGRARARWVETRAASFLEGLAVLGDWRRALGAAFWSAAAWVVAGLATYLLLRGFVPGATIPMGFFVLTVLGLAAAVPSAPGAAGVFELSITKSLAVFGVEQNLALSFAIVYHVLQLGITTLLGSLALAREGETLAHLAHAAQSLVGGRRVPETDPAPVVQAPHPAHHSSSSPPEP